MVDDNQNLCVLELREVATLEEDVARAVHFGREDYYYADLGLKQELQSEDSFDLADQPFSDEGISERSGLITCTMNRFSAQKGLAHFSVLKNKVATLKDDGTVNNFEMKRPLNAPGWVKNPTETWRFRTVDPSAQFTTICLSDKFICAASYSMPPKYKSDPRNPLEHQISIFVASPQGHRASSQFELYGGENTYRASQLNPVHTMQYVEYKGVPLLICVRKFDYVHVLALSKCKPPKMVHQLGPDGRSPSGREYTGLIQLMGNKSSKQQSLSFVIVGPSNYMLQLHIFTPKIDYKRFLKATV